MMRTVRQALERLQRHEGTDRQRHQKSAGETAREAPRRDHQRQKQNSGRGDRQQRHEGQPAVPRMLQNMRTRMRIHIHHTVRQVVRGENTEHRSGDSSQTT